MVRALSVPRLLGGRTSICCTRYRNINRLLGTPIVTHRQPFARAASETPSQPGARLVQEMLDRGITADEVERILKSLEPERPFDLASKWHAARQKSMPQAQPAKPQVV